MIVPIDSGNIEEAAVLTRSLFPKENPPAEEWLYVSIGRDKNNLIEKHELRMIEYFMYQERSKCIGITGIYELSRDWKVASWAGWLGVDPCERRRGIGSKMLDFIIDRAKKDSKRFLRLFTDTDAVNAHVMYRKYGFYLVGDTADTLYYELDQIQEG